MILNSFGDLLEGKDAVEARATLLARRVQQEVEECPQLRHGKEAAFVLYVNFRRIIVVLSELVVQV